MEGKTKLVFGVAFAALVVALGATISPTLLQPVLAWTCFDTDGGFNIGVGGSVAGYDQRDNYYQFFDKCNTLMGNKQIIEYYCQGVMPASLNAQCDNFRPECNNQCYCSINACTHADSCTDSDGGQMWLMPGAVSGWANGQVYNFADSCANTTFLFERYCSGNTAVVVAFDCASIGGNCANGRCI